MNVANIRNPITREDRYWMRLSTQREHFMQIKIARPTPIAAEEQQVKAPEPKGMDPYATHQEALIAACSQTTGPIVELGCGDSSTKLLHSAFPDRCIVSVDHNADWLNRYTYLRTSNHVFMLVADYLNFTLPVSRAGVLFIDSDPGEQRKLVLMQQANNADFIVVHDTEPNCHPKYQWGDCFDSFLFRHTDARYERWTEVVSNKFKFVPPAP